AGAVHAQSRDVLGERPVVGRHQPAFAGAAEILARVEAEAGEAAARAHAAAAAVAGADRLRGVLEQRHAQLAGQREQRVEVGGLPVQVHRQDRAQPRAARRRRARRPRIERTARGLDVGEHGSGAEPRDGACGGEEGEGGAEHLVAGPDAERLQGEQQRVGARAARDRVLRLAVGRELALERLDLLAEHEALALEDAIDGGAQLAADAGILRAQIEGGYPHVRSSPSSEWTSRCSSATKRGVEKRSAWLRISLGSKNASAASKRSTARAKASSVWASNQTPVARAAPSGGPSSGSTVSVAPPRA